MNSKTTDSYDMVMYLNLGWITGDTTKSSKRS